MTKHSKSAAKAKPATASDGTESKARNREPAGTESNACDHERDGTDKSRAYDYGRDGNAG